MFPDTPNYKRPLQSHYHGLYRMHRTGEERVRVNGLAECAVAPDQESGNGYSFARTNLAHEKSGSNKTRLQAPPVVGGSGNMKPESMKESGLVARPT